jgi:hypothetical protein
MVRIDVDKLLAENQQLREKNEKAEQNLKKAEGKAEEDMMQIIQSICQQSPWKHLQFNRVPGSASASSTHSPSSKSIRSPTMNKGLRKAFRILCARICQITGSQDSPILTIAHIVPKKNVAQSMIDWEIEYSCNSAKTVLLLVNPLEASFDRGDFCLLLKPVPGTAEEALAVKVLNGSIKEDTIPGISDCKLKFKDLEDKFLDVRLNVPSYRCIAKHSYYSLAAAASKGWIRIPEYLDLSAKIKDQSPEQEQVAWVQQWLRDFQGQLPNLTSLAHSTLDRAAARTYLIPALRRRSRRTRKALPRRLLGRLLRCRGRPGPRQAASRGLASAGLGHRYQDKRDLAWHLGPA